ncbi:MAG: hypothetical protein WC723_02750 [Candidatus Omnitrophota bacterium]
MKKYTLCLALILGISMPAYCGQISRIELTDGSIIEGEIASLNKGTYTVNTASLGKIEINLAKIRRITTENTTIAPILVTKDLTPVTQETPSPQTKEAINSEMERMQSKIANDPETIKSVSKLLLDPQFQEILKDPEIADAVKSQDIKSLMKNEKFMSLMKNQELQNIQGRLEEQK